MSGEEGQKDGTEYFARGRCARDAVAAVDRLHPLYGDDRQSAIWLDPVCAADEQGARLGGRGYPDCVQLVRRAGDLAHPVRGLDRRLSRAAARPEIIDDPALER